MSYAMERAIARTKSYIGPALLVSIFYGLGWLPGFIANWMYYREAKRMQRLAGESLPGAGCLSVMFWVNLAVLVLFGLQLLDRFQEPSSDAASPQAKTF
jgi:hypothetical protein